MSTNSLLTRCKQRAVRYSPRSTYSPFRLEQTPYSHVASNVRYIPCNENKLRTHTLQARCGTFTLLPFFLAMRTNTLLSTKRYAI